MKHIGPIEHPIELIDKRVVTFKFDYFEIDGKRYATCYLGNIKNKSEIMIRIESACIFGHVFGVVRCDCKYQLMQALYKIEKEKIGMIIYAIDQDCRGLGIDKHFETYFLRQNENLETKEVYEKLNLKIDNREYKDIPTILKFYNIKSVRCLTNNPQKLKCIESSGIKCEQLPLEMPLDDNNKTLLMDIKENLEYSFTFKTHQEWFSYINSKFIEKNIHDKNDAQGYVITEDYKLIIAEGYNISKKCTHMIQKIEMNLNTKNQNLKAYLKGDICNQCLKILKEKNIKTVYIEKDNTKLNKTNFLKFGIKMEII